MRDLRFEFKVWLLRCKRDWAYDSMERKWKKAKKKNPSWDKQEFYETNQYDIHLFYDRIDSLISTHWLEVADRWNITVPPQSDKEHWDKSPLYRWVLTRHGVSCIRKAYFELKMNTQSMIIPWLTFWLALVGADGALWQVFRPAK